MTEAARELPMRSAPAASTGDALGNGVELYKAGCKHVALLALAGAAASNAPRLFVDFGVEDLAQLSSGTYAVPWSAVPWSVLLWVAASQLVALFFQLGVAVRLHALARGGAIGLGRALAIAVRRTPAMLVVMAMALAAITLGVVLAALLANALTFGLFLAFPPLGEARGAAMLFWAVATVITLLLALPLVTLLVYWYFAFFLVVTEARGGLAALRRSYQLVRGHLWRMKFALTAVYLSFFVALAVAEMAAAAVGAVFASAPVLGEAAAFVAVAVGGAVAGPIPIAASLALLYDLALRRAPAASAG